MRKTIILILAIFFGVQSSSISQNAQEILDMLGKESKGTYLKDFELDINPVETAKFSMVLSKNTKYEFSFYEHETDQLQFNFYKDGEQNQESTMHANSLAVKNAKIEDPLDSKKQSYDMNPYKIIKLKNITQHEYIISETGIYHMFVRNNTFIPIKTVVLLSFLERNVSTEEEEIIPINKQEETQNQNNQQLTKNEEQYFFVVEEMPKFNGQNADKFSEFLQKEIKYPQEAIDKKIEGKVMVQFVIDKDGYIKEAKIVTSVHPALDQEALSVVYSSPRWQPGKQRGQNVIVVFTFPIKFKLP